MKAQQDCRWLLPTGESILFEPPVVPLAVEEVRALLDRLGAECRVIGPQGEELRFDPDQPRDPDGKFATGATVTVYHGKALNAGTGKMHPKGFYVTADQSMAEKYFGDVHKVDVPVSELIPDTEQEGQADKKLTGLESLKMGSAVAPHKYYEKLTKVGPKVYKSRLGRVTIPEE